jgi:putative PIN family toxin of toxin-antitoxin system
VKTQRFVIDTNVYLSALLFGGNPRKIIESALLDGHVVIISEEIYTEMRKVVTKKFPKFVDEYKVLEALLRINTISVQFGTVSVTACRDSKDNMILETAILGSCEYIITGDSDLLVLQSYKKIPS